MCSFITAAPLTWLNLSAREEDCFGQEEGKNEISTVAVEGAQIELRSCGGCR